MQAARAGDARELAAAQRREQDLTQDNSALKARHFQHLHAAMWEMLRTRVPCVVQHTRARVGLSSATSLLRLADYPLISAHG